MAITWNPEDKSADITLSNGNLTASSTINSGKMVRATSSVSSGKWYFEFSYITFPYSYGEAWFGIAQAEHPLNAYVGDYATGWSWNDYGEKWHGGSYSAYGTPGGSSPIVMCAVDMDEGKLWFGLNGTWMAGGDPAAGTGAAFTDVSGSVYPAVTPADETSITGRFTAASQSYAPPTGFSAIDSTITAVSHLLPAASLTWTAHAPQPVYTPPATQPVRYLYRAYLTGDAEDPPVADLELPLASFQSTRRNGSDSYLSLVVPNPGPYLDAIDARPDGDLVIYSGFALQNGVEVLNALITVHFDDLRYDLGARSGSATLTGHQQVTYSNPRTRALVGISYLSATNGVRRLRCDPDMYLSPGDTATWGGGESLTVGTISYTISPARAVMEVAEAEI